LNAVQVSRAVTVVGLLGAAAASWMFLVQSEAVMSSMQGDGVLMDLMTAIMRPSIAAPYVAAAAVMWIVMMAAMMTPAVLPVVVLFSRLDRRPRYGLEHADAALFAGGYLSVWVGFALAATVVQWVLHRAAFLDGHMVKAAPALAGTLLLAAGLYQLTPFKTACLAHCQSPIGFPDVALARRRCRCVSNGRAPRRALSWMLLGIDAADVRLRGDERRGDGGVDDVHPCRTIAAAGVVVGQGAWRGIDRLGLVDIFFRRVSAQRWADREAEGVVMRSLKVLAACVCFSAVPVAGWAQSAVATVVTAKVKGDPAAYIDKLAAAKPIVLRLGATSYRVFRAEFAGGNAGEIISIAEYEDMEAFAKARAARAADPEFQRWYKDLVTSGVSELVSMSLLEEVTPTASSNTR
jgi:hypothetical protein